MFFNKRTPKTEAASASELQEIAIALKSLEKKVESLAGRIESIEEESQKTAPDCAAEKCQDGAVRTQQQRSQNTGFVRIDNLAGKIALKHGKSKKEVSKWLWDTYGHEVVIFGSNRRGFPKAKAKYIESIYPKFLQADEAGNR